MGEANRRVLLGACLVAWATAACTSDRTPAACGYLSCGYTTGAAGSSGQPPPVVSVPKEAAPSEGCGKPLPAKQPKTVPGEPTGYLHYSVMLTGTTLSGIDQTRASPRSFWVRVPVDYAPDHPYRLVYIATGCGRSNDADTASYKLFDEGLGGTEQAIYVALDHPSDQSNMDCFDTRAGLGSEEWETFAAVQRVVDSTYCVDDNSIFITSYGDDGVSLANTWGCYFAGNPAQPRAIAPGRHILGQASVSGGEPPVQPACGGPVAALWIHDKGDSACPYQSDVNALDRVLKGNGCQGDHTDSPTAPWPPMPDICVQYTSCPAEFPVVFCTTEGLGHSWQQERAIPAFRALADLASPWTRAPQSP